MNNLLLLTLGTILWQLLLLPVVAQKPPLDARHPLIKTVPDSLAVLKNRVDLQDLRYAISPDDAVFSGKKSQEKRWRRENKAFLLKHVYERMNGVTGSHVEQMSPEQAAAIDQGILFNPDETRVPAGIVISPLRDVDPAMVHDPGPFQEKTPIKRNIFLPRKKNQH